MAISSPVWMSGRGRRDRDCSLEKSPLASADPDRSMAGLGQVGYPSACRCERYERSLRGPFETPPAMPASAVDLIGGARR
jgi:hypothetical protein